MRTFLSGLAALLATVAAYATDIIVPSEPTTLTTIPNEDSFRANGVKIVRSVHVDLLDGNGQIGIGWAYDTPNNAELTEAQLLAFGKESAQTHLGMFGLDAFIENPTTDYQLEINWSTEVEHKFYLIPPFHYSARFVPVKGASGQWQAPASVVEGMKMEFGEYVFAQLENTKDVRLRWWDGERFNDYSYPYQNVTLQSVKKSSSSEDLIPLPTTPLLKKSLGILTRRLTDRTIIRYSTSNRLSLPGTQEDKEPLLIGLRQEPGGARILPSGDFTDVSTIKFERSQDFQKWSEIVRGVDGGLSDGGMGIIPKEIEFFRARYR